MLAPMFVVILTVIYVKKIESGDSLKVRLLRKNTALVYNLMVTVVA